MYFCCQSRPLNNRLNYPAKKEEQARPGKISQAGVYPSQRKVLEDWRFLILVLKKEEQLSSLWVRRTLEHAGFSSERRSFAPAGICEK